MKTEWNYVPNRLSGSNLETLRLFTEQRAIACYGEAKRLGASKAGIRLTKEGGAWERRARYIAQRLETSNV